jgi:hypothetical protein
MHGIVAAPGKEAEVKGPQVAAFPGGLGEEVEVVPSVVPGPEDLRGPVEALPARLFPRDEGREVVHLVSARGMGLM